MKNKSNFYVGLFLIIIGILRGGSVRWVIGILLLLDNLHLVDLNFFKLLRLWPLLLISWGLKYIPMKETMRHVLNWLVIITFLLLFLFGPDTRWHVNGPWGGWHSNVTFDNDDETDDNDGASTKAKDVFISAKMTGDIKAGHLEMTIPAVDLQMGSPTDALYALALEDFPIPYRSRMNLRDSVADVRLEPEKHGNFDLDEYNPTGTLQLNAGIPWEIALSSGASDIDLDLSPYRVRELNIQSGASSIWIKAGNKAKETNIKIKAGASDITLEIPDDADVIFHVKNVLGAQDIDGLTDVGKGEFRNKNYGKSDRLIRVDISSAVSSLKVKRY